MSCCTTRCRWTARAWSGLSGDVRACSRTASGRLCLSPLPAAASTTRRACGRPTPSCGTRATLSAAVQTRNLTCCGSRRWVSTVGSSSIWTWSRSDPLDASHRSFINRNPIFATRSCCARSTLTAAAPATPSWDGVRSSARAEGRLAAAYSLAARARVSMPAGGGGCCEATMRGGPTLAAPATYPPSWLSHGRASCTRRPSSARYRASRRESSTTGTWSRLRSRT
mmetsp:Transcript_17788/g.56890  ORF Transcript_17788/g.56890 Transcript_17788/m.56890 type:complete len:225 (-) Transcript_17788:324-998(-)